MKRNRQGREPQPLLNLLLIPAQLVIDVIVICLAMWVDVATFDPPEGMLGTPFPVWGLLAACLMAVVTIVVVIVAIVRTVSRSVQKKQLRKYREAAAAQPEYMAAYDGDFHMIEGVALVRGEPIPDGMYTLVCKVLVQHRDGTYLITRRDPQKKFGGGMWEASAGGTAQKGEDGEACIRRELWEETGIRAGALTELSRVCIKDLHSFYAEYLCVTDVKKKSVVLQPGETVEYRWVTKEELLAMPREELAPPRVLDYIGTL